MSWQQDLFDAETRHAISVRRFSSGEVKDVLAVLRKADNDLVSKLRIRLKQGESLQTKRMQALLTDIRDLRRTLWRQVHKANKTDMLAFSKVEAAFEKSAFEATIGLELNYASVSASTLNALVTQQPFSGGANAARTLGQWWDGLAAADTSRITEAIQLGVTQGETVDQMVSRVRQSTQLSSRNAEAVVRTAVNHVTNAARGAFFDANDDIISFLRWSAMLDGRTSMICASRDGRNAPVTGTSREGVPQPWLVPPTARPPAHPNCRSQMVAGLDPEGIEEIMPARPFVRDTRTRRRREIDFRAKTHAKLGDKRWKSMTPKQRNVAIKRERIRWVKKNVGTIKGDVSYDEWLRTQPASFQDKVLGKGKAKLFRDGMKLDKYVDRKGNELTLDQLETE